MRWETLGFSLGLVEMVETRGIRSRVWTLSMHVELDFELMLSGLQEFVRSHSSAATLIDRPNKGHISIAGRFRGSGVAR